MNPYHGAEYFIKMGCDFAETASFEVPPPEVEEWIQGAWKDLIPFDIDGFLKEFNVSIPVGPFNTTTLPEPSGPAGDAAASILDKKTMSMIGVVTDTGDKKYLMLALLFGLLTGLVFALGLLMSEILISKYNIPVL